MTAIARSGVGCRVLGGVDTHKDVHVGAVIDDVGRILATAEFPATRHGYRRLLAWLSWRRTTASPMGGKRGASDAGVDFVETPCHALQ